MIDRIVRKLAIPALLAACVGVLTIARAHSDAPIRAGAIGSSSATKAVLGARMPAGDARGGSGVPMQPDWGSSGQNNHNTRSAAAEHTINAGNVGNLKTAWIFTTAGDVSATATVVNGVAYFPDWGGKLWAVDTKTGKAVWSHDVSDYTGTAGSASRTSPAYWNGELVIGTGNLMTPNLSPAFEIGINALSGAMLWRTQTDANQAAIMTGSATIDNGIVYTGISSKTEHTTVTPTFRGSVEALDARTGKILWKTYMVPAGFNGAAVWSSQPVVDHRTGMLYVTTGNSYSVPNGYCVNPGQTNCKRLPPDAYIDCIVALRLTTGKIVWAHHTLTADTWTMANPNASPDFDFGADPNLYTTTIEGKRTDVLGAGQKSGMYYALDPATGEEIWATQAGPGGVLGGIEWGTSADGERIYAAITNGSHKTYNYTTYDGEKKTTSGGLWTALDAATGKILWQTADPQGSQYITDGFVSSANGVVYAGSSGGNFYAMDAATGQIRWTFPSGGAVWSGAAIVDGVVYWGSGYDTRERKLPYDGNNNKFYAFSLNGR
ncbi:MAG: PQQ-like domain [Candidatus Sulfotelmatobacter sp.]|nr:PQQ-like domain [Candidatus Sulfotelmatobacter sp.]